MMARSRKVLHILHAFSPGGLENGIVNIINGSPPDIEHELCFLTKAGEFLQRLKKPVPYYELHKQPGNSINTIMRLYRLIRKSGADIVHTRNWAAFDGVIACCFCPGIILLHGEHGRDMADPQGLNRRRNLLRRLFSPRIKKFTTVSEDLKRWLCKEVGIPQNKITLIRNGVDTERFRPHHDPGLRRELGLAEHEFVVGTIGRLDPVKNHAGLIEAFAIFAKKVPNARLMIIGDGPERENLERIIQSSNIAHSSVLLGYRRDIERIYAVFDVFVLNSLAEGMSNTLLEAMSCGLPVLCTAVGANMELVGDGERGLLISPGDRKALISALHYYHDSPECRRTRSLAARSFIEQNFGLSLMIQKYVRLYLDIS